MIESAMSRRAFVAGAAASAAAVIAAQRVALASESKEADEKAAPEDAQEDAAEQTETINSSGIVVDPEKVTEVISTDILIVGGGLSGLAAAVQALSIRPESSQPQSSTSHSRLSAELLMRSL